ncbi:MULTISPECIES: lysozyme [Pontibacillus]|uniref:Lysozyme n=1 Tax=Pontibacillus chungwhensis TaxID=265426 RepID=A0ABY8UZY9_9BACI|nr:MULTISPECIES: lysozyme [Pontibacillus]MCD5324784.1 lysozyme [Pontibacillus sp. HN14]WIF98743.1 lysozyme [Pontibacillus chungwhensis]
MRYTITAESKKINYNPTPVEEIIQNVYTILTTVMGTVPMARELGLSNDYVDDPLLIAQAKLSAEIVEKLQVYEERAVIVEVKFSQNQADGVLQPIVVINIEEEYIRERR